MDVRVCDKLAAPLSPRATGLRWEDRDSPAIAPDAAAVKDRSQALTSNRFFSVRNKPTDEINAFIVWVLSAARSRVAANVAGVAPRGAFASRTSASSEPARRGGGRARPVRTGGGLRTGS